MGTTHNLPAIAIAAALMLPVCPAFAQRPAPKPSMALELPPAQRPVAGVAIAASSGPMTPMAMATIASEVRRQLQPCADRQVIPAPEASQIVAIVQLDLNRDGSLAKLRILGHKGVTESNQRYVPRVDEAVEAIFTGCTPIQGLPPELYDVPRGWRTMKFQYRLKA
jgi:hypothetical protein